MTKISFERVTASIKNQRHSWFSKTEWARCNLALPVGELRSIAMVINSLDWIEQAAEQDCTLMIRLDYKQPWILQERSYHQLLAIARTMVTEQIDSLKTCMPEATLTPEASEILPEYGYAYRHINGRSLLVMPEKYKTGFGMAEDDTGTLAGYFLTQNNYDDDQKALAIALLTALHPKLGISYPDRFEKGDVRMENPGPINPDLAVLTYNVAGGMIKKFKVIVAALEWGGKPSSFTREDNQAREWLAIEMQKGARITQKRIENAEYDDVDGVCSYYLEDGTELPHTIVQRLINSRIIEGESGPFYERTEDDKIPDLVLNPKANAEQIGQNENAVPFQAFESYCQHRRYDNDSECRHPKRRGDYCSPEHCPITIQIYHEDARSYGCRNDNEPAFDSYNWERDAFVRPLHANTTRSRAWLAAGEMAVEAVVNQVISDTYHLGIPRRLFGSENMHAVTMAIEAGHLIIDEEMPGFGIVVMLSDNLKAKIDDQIRQQKEKNAPEEVI